MAARMVRTEQEKKLRTVISVGKCKYKVRISKSKAKIIFSWKKSKQRKIHPEDLLKTPTSSENKSGTKYHSFEIQLTQIPCLIF